MTGVGVEAFVARKCSAWPLTNSVGISSEQSPLTVRIRQSDFSSCDDVG